ncbi:MAG: hypothetical protein H7A44_07570 [Opitutaceae bacterium]|nr:hypothetical protein [Opitutaceae bacterium]
MKILIRITLMFAVALSWSETAAAPRRSWNYAQSENFEMMTSASVGDSRELLADFEEFHALLQAAFGQPRIAKKRTTLVVFEYQEDFEPYKPLTEEGQRRNVAAYFLGHPEESLIAMVAGPASAREVRETVYHEYVHHFFDLMGYKLPLWLNEGLADLFSTMQIKRNRLELGHAKIGYMNAMLSTWDLDWLFSVGKGSDSYHGGIAQQQFYAQSWALVHFWFCSPEMFPSYLKFLDLIENSGKDSAECMEEAFGMNTEQMKDALDAYLKKGRYQLRQLPLAEKPERKRYAFRRATDFEQELTLLNLEARALGLVESEIKLIELAERYPAEPRPYEILAALAGRKGKAQERLDYYAKAVALGSRNSQVHVLRAGLALSRVDVGSSLDYRMPEDQAEPLRESLRTAFAANPNHDAIIDLLAYLESVAAKPKLSSVELVQKQVKGMRDSREALLSLAVIRWRIKDHATAEAILGMLRGRKPLEGGAMQRMELLEARLGLSATAAQ